MHYEKLHELVEHWNKICELSEKIAGISEARKKEMLQQLSTIKPNDSNLAEQQVIEALRGYLQGQSEMNHPKQNFRIGVWAVIIAALILVAAIAGILIAIFKD